MPNSNETKQDRFKRLASTRVSEILKRVKTLGNLSNTSQYSYTDDQVRKIFAALERESRLAKEKFKSAKNGGAFKL